MPRNGKVLAHDHAPAPALSTCVIGRPVSTCTPSFSSWRCELAHVPITGASLDQVEREDCEPGHDRSHIAELSIGRPMKFSTSKAIWIWVIGLLTLVPYCIHELLFEATRDQYALLIVLPLFWIFGYWGVMGPILMAMKVRTVMRLIESARSRDDLLKALRSQEARDSAIDLIASENRIPRLLASRVFDLLCERLTASGAASASSKRPA